MSDQSDSYPHCVVCFKPLGDDEREFPDGCLAHERCFVQAPYEEVRSHMGLLDDEAIEVEGR